jgi:small subunit ribosomal protein S11
MATKVTKKKKIKKVVHHAQAHIQSTFNNTIITITDLAGNALAAASSGASGFRGSRKSTPYSAQVATEIAVEKAKAYGIEKIDVYVKGIGSGRDSAIRTLHSSGLFVSSIKDVTPVPHNGCRPRKPRRV